MKQKKWYKSYTLGFCCVALIILLLFMLTGKSFLWKADGFQQHFTSVYYFGKYVRTLLTTGRAPMIDFNIGEGLDILTSMGYYGFGDPLNLIFCFANDATAEYLYAFMIFVRWYLCGITFGIFASRFFKNQTAIATGCLVYVFSGYLMFFSIQAPTFINGAMYLPIILYTLESAFEDHKYSPLIAITGLMWLSNFYMAALTTMLAFFYSVIRIVLFFNKSHIKNYFGIIGAYILGTLLSSVVLLPMVYAFLGCGRGDVTTGYQGSMLHYPLTYYLAIIRNLVSPVDSRGYWSAPHNIHLSLLPIFVPSLFLFLQHKTEKHTYARFLKYGLLSVAIFATVPIFGKIFNGFAYVTHRWAFGFAFVAALVVVWAVPRFKEAAKKTKILTCITLLVGWILVAVTRETPTAIVLCVLLIYMLLLILSKKVSEHRIFVFSIICAVLYFLSTMILCGYVVSFANSNVMDEIKSEYPTAVKADDDFYRISEPVAGNNHSALLKYKGVTSYYSITPKELGNYYTSLGLNTARMTFWTYGLDDRAVLNSLSSVKYYTVPHGASASVPYGFSYVYSNGDVDVYANEYVLPIGYVYKQQLPMATFDTLNPIEKQIALLKYAVVESDDVDSGETPTTHTFELEYERENTPEGIKITFEAPKDCEVYVVFKNMTTQSSALKSVTVNTGDLTKHVFVRGPENHCYFSSLYVSVNLGYKNNGVVTCYINETLNRVTYDELKVYALPLSVFRNGVKELQKNVLTDVSYSGTSSGERQNYFSGKITVQDDGVLQLGLPYSSGWRVYIDGEKVDTFVCGLKYIGVNIKAGEHEVEAIYRTPMIVAGAIVTCLSFFMLVVIMYVEYKKGKLTALSSVTKHSFCKFLIAGGITTACDYVLYMAISSVLPVGVSKAISMSISCVISYFINKRWSFRVKSKSSVTQIGKFAGSQIINIVLNTTINYLLYSLLLNKTVAFVFATAISMSVNFVLQKCWVFKEKGGQSASC